MTARHSQQTHQAELTQDQNTLESAARENQQLLGVLPPKQKRPEEHPSLHASLTSSSPTKGQRGDGATE